MYETIYDLFEHAKENNLPGMMLLVDIEKAFDSVNFDFIINIFNFREHFKEWIKILLGMNINSGFQAVTIVNGNISKKTQCSTREQTRRPPFGLPVNFGNINIGFEF